MMRNLLQNGCPKRIERIDGAQFTWFLCSPLNCPIATSRTLGLFSFFENNNGILRRGHGHFGHSTVLEGHFELAFHGVLGLL